MSYKKLYKSLMSLDKDKRNVVISALSETALKEVFVIMKKTNSRPLNEILSKDEKITKKGEEKENNQSVKWAAKRLSLRNDYEKCKKLPPEESSKCKEEVTKKIRLLAKETKKKINK